MRPYRSVVAPWRAALLAVAVVSVAMPAARAAAPAKAGKARYVVLLKDAGANAKAVADNQSRKHRFAVDSLFNRGLRGYVATMSPAVAKILARTPGVLAVAPDDVMTTVAEQDLRATPYFAVPAIWGLDRIDQVALPLDATYRYNMTASGVTAYVVDSGVKSDHDEFEGRVDGRAFDAYRSAGHADYGEDCDGHGTHVAGTLGGKYFGVAKDVEIVSVRVLDCTGSGFVSDIVEGIDWMVADHGSGQPAVANMSFGGSRNTALDAAVGRAINDGITVAIAAGNGGMFGAQDACKVSPARVKDAVTVGATEPNDRKAGWSNYGSCVDLFAPGANIVSADGAAANDNSWAQMSGTSMAAPHAAGVAALLLSAVPGATPAQIRQSLVAVATANKVTSSRTTNPKLLYGPSNLVTGQLPGAAPPAPAPTTTTTTSTTTPTPTTTTTRPCFIFCWRR